jgi:hypothetical protein
MTAISLDTSRYEPFVCPDDTDAIERAKRLVDDHDVELWSGARLIIRLETKLK